MALTAAITLSSATCVAEQSVACTCTVSNSGAAAVTVLSITPTAPINGTTQETTSIAKGQPPTGPGMTVSVAASGSTAFTWPMVPHAPTTDGTSTPAEPASLVYSIGATVYTSDGAVTVATPATVTVTNPAGL
jgi:hypothetical protein